MHVVLKFWELFFHQFSATQCSAHTMSKRSQCDVLLLYQLVLERKLCGSVFDVQFPFCEIEIHERKCAPKIVSVLQSLIRVLIISVNKFQHVSKNSCCLSRWFVMLLRILISVANFKIARIEICGNTERIIQKRIDCLSSCWHH